MRSLLARSELDCRGAPDIGASLARGSILPCGAFARSVFAGVIMLLALAGIQSRAMYTLPRLSVQPSCRGLAQRRSAR